jgi:hypothetical protein
MIRHRAACILVLIATLIAVINGAPTSNIEDEKAKPAGELDGKLSTEHGSESVASESGDELPSPIDTPTGNSDAAENPSDADKKTIKSRQLVTINAVTRVTLPKGGHEQSGLNSGHLSPRTAAETGRRRRQVSNDRRAFPPDDKGIPWDTMKLVNGDGKSTSARPKKLIKTALIDDQVVRLEVEFITLPSASAAIAEASM